MNGWASYITYRTWLKESDELQGLLAIRLAWELIVYRYNTTHHEDAAKQVSVRWRHAIKQLSHNIEQFKRQETMLWVMMYAYEHEQQHRCI